MTDMSNYIITNVENDYSEIFVEDGKQYIHYTGKVILDNCGKSIEGILEIPKMLIDLKNIELRSDVEPVESEYIPNVMYTRSPVRFCVVETDDVFWKICIPEDEEERLDALLNDIK